MPEEIEIDTDKLRESIDEELNRQGGALLRWISLSTAILAMLARPHQAATARGLLDLQARRRPHPGRELLTEAVD